MPPEVELDDDQVENEELEGAEDTGDELEAEVVVSFGEEDEAEQQNNQAPDWVRDLRAKHKEERARNRELQRQLEALRGSQTDTLGPKPTLADCDYDEDVFNEKLDAWLDKKHKVDERQAQQAQEQQQAQQAWQNTVNEYQAKAQALNVPDYDDAEDVVKSTFSEAQQGILLDVAENSANMVYALSKHPKKLAELAGIASPLKFAAAIAKLEGKLKVTTRKPAVEPEQVLNGQGHAPANSQAQLDRTRAKARKTGGAIDVTEAVRLKRQARSQTQ